MDKIQVSDYYSEEAFNRISAMAAVNATPCVVFDIPTMAEAYNRLKSAFPFASIYYAMKANPDMRILSDLEARGSSFDVASTYELDKLLKTGVCPSRLSYGNTIKKASWVKHFYDRGVRLFSTDSDADLAVIAAQAPGSRVYVRVLTDGSGAADWPLSRKFGCSVEYAVNLLGKAASLGLDAYGVSFHVGSQQRDISCWDSALAKTKWIFDEVQKQFGVQLRMVNMGGGFPAHYLKRVAELEEYARQITQYLHNHFGPVLPEVFLEPGRSLVADAGVLVSEVVLVSTKEQRENADRWVFVDVGKFSGLIETMDESIKYPLYPYKMTGESKGDFDGELSSAIIAGPTCDSADIMYENYKYGLPKELAAGDLIFWLSAGAYTTSYSAIEFNGFPPLRCVFTTSDEPLTPCDAESLIETDIVENLVIV